MADHLTRRIELDLDADQAHPELVELLSDGDSPEAVAV
jgi:hypothetical protein